jgi:hypothetical protein
MHANPPYKGQGDEGKSVKHVSKVEIKPFSAAVARRDSGKLFPPDTFFVYERSRHLILSRKGIGSSPGIVSKMLKNLTIEEYLIRLVK